MASAVVSPGDLRALVSGAYQDVTEDGPVEVPMLHELHQIERNHLVRFAAAVLRRHGVTVIE